MPAMYIDTASGSMDHVHEAKGNEEQGNMRLYAADGTLNFIGRLEHIQSRGNATFYKPKKPYGIKLADGADLLGMGEAKKWVLLANAGDGTNLRDKLCYDFAAEAGLPYTPKCEWVELYLNGEYAGLYLLAERNEVHTQRVNLRDGQGFLLSQELQERLEKQGLPHLLTEASVPLRIHYSSWEDGAVADWIQRAENAMLAPDGIDPMTGKHWSELIDIDSWARKYLMEEIFGGGDAGFLSQFYHYEGNSADGKLYAGPIWDYDYTMGIDNRDIAVPEMFYAHRKATSPWFHGLYEKEDFYDRVTELYRETFQPLLGTYLIEKFPAYIAYVEPAAMMNQLRWGRDFYAELSHAQSYMKKRMAFLSSVWVEGTHYVEVTVVPPDTSPLFSVNYAVVPGETLPDKLVSQPWDWFVWKSDEQFDISQPIREDITIYAVSRPAPQERVEEVPVDEAESRVNWELRLPIYATALLLGALVLADIQRLRKRRIKSHAKG